MKSASNNENYEFRVYPDEKSPKLFKSPLLEVLTKTKLWVIILLYSAAAILWLWIYVHYFKGGTKNMILLFVLGFFTWTFWEYVLHRFVYHKLKDASYDTGMQYVFHGIHHQYPSDEDRIILPPIPGLAIACLFLGINYLIMGGAAFTFGAGLLIGYLVYISIHWMVHSKPTPTRFNFWWRHHTIHHYQQHDKAFGVSTPIWDIVFRTMPVKEEKQLLF